jgi:16S rRNA (cytosine967-C5)-methyltransferase
MANPNKRLTVLTTHPEWIIAVFRDALQQESRGNELLSSLDVNNATPRVNLVALPGPGVLPREVG